MQSMDWDNPQIVMCKQWIHTLHQGHNPRIVTGIYFAESVDLGMVDPLLITYTKL